MTRIRYIYGRRVGPGALHIGPQCVFAVLPGLLGSLVEVVVEVETFVAGVLAGGKLKQDSDKPHWGGRHLGTGGVVQPD